MKKLFILLLVLAMVAVVFADTFTIGTGSSSTSYSPFYGLYDYGWNKIIYTASEINTAGLTGASDIHGVGFYAYNTPVNYIMMDQKVYVRHTALANYGTATDETGTGYPASAGFTQVFDADVVFNGIGWYYIMFATPFPWNGTDNLEIFWENWDGDYYSGYPTHSYTSTSSNYMTVYKYADNNFPAIVGSRTYNRPNLRLVTQPLDAAIPATLVSPADNGGAFGEAMLVWNNGQGTASSYDLYFGTSSNPPLVANLQDMTYAPTLTPGNTYYWKVVARNANGAAASSPVWSFYTPRANQLAESFEDTAFPPLGWSNPGSFTRSTSTPYHLSAGAYKSTATAAMLCTPMLELTASSELNFMARSGSTTGIGRIQIKRSADGLEWTPVGDEIAMPTNSTWNNYLVDLSELDGDNYYLGFEVYSSTTSSTTFYIDYVFGPDFAALLPEPAAVIYPDAGGWAFLDSSLSWTAAGTGGIPTTYDVYFGTSNPPPYVTNQSETTYTPTLVAASTYYWKIVPRNDTGPAADCPVWSFQTPSANQLVESFEVATPFPPVGWANPGSWSGTTSSPFHGSRVAYKSASTTPAILSTPILAITATSVLDFYYRTASTTGYGLLNIKYSTDRVSWSQIGDPIPMPAVTTWNHANVALGSIPAGNYYLAFEVSTSSSTSSIYIDHVFGPQLAAVAPGPVTLSAPAAGATNVLGRPAFSWTEPTIGGVATGYKLYCDTNANPSTELADLSTPSYTPVIPLAYDTLYYWKVVAYNGTGNSADSDIRSFTTMADPTLYAPWLEDFGTTGTTFPPANWTRHNGLLENPSTLTTTSSGWIQDDFANIITDPTNKSARLNIFGTAYKYWLMSPPIQMPGAGYQLEFDIALTKYNAPEAPIDPAGYSGVDDRFAVLISDGVTWSTAHAVKIWDNDSSTNGAIYEVYNDVPHTGSHWVLPLDSYTGIQHIAFYGESTVSNADNDFFVDNVMMRHTPSGAPDHVTLNSPGDLSTDLPKENVTLAWTPAITGGTPVYYEVYVGENRIDPETDYYGEFFYETPDSYLNLSAQNDIDLGYGNTWYWAILPYNSAGHAPDVYSDDLLIWSFTTAEDPTIVALPYEEYFDSVTAPALPYGWTAYLNSTSTSAVVATYSSTTYANSAPNSVRLYNPSDADADLRLITPLIDVPLNTIKLKFYARSSSAGYPLLVGTVNATDGTGTFTQLQSINLSATVTEYIISLQDYTGDDQYICFKHGLGGTGRSLYVDDVRLIELLARDLATTSISNPGIMVAGTAYDFTIDVYNEGTAAQNAYAVKLMSGPTTLATLNVSTPLASGASAQHTLSWTPITGGVQEVYARVVLAGDQYVGNNDSDTTRLYILDSSMSVLSIGDDETTTSGTSLPINMYWRNSVTEELYFTDEMHLQSGTITAIVYKNTFVNERLDKPIKIWMAHTEVTDLSGGWLPALDYTLVFDGTVDFPVGTNYIVIPLNTPYVFTGGTLATRVNRVFDSGALSSSDKFFYTTTPAHTNRSRYLNSDSITYTPLAPEATGTAVGYVPNTMFIVQNAVMETGAVLEGYVRDASNNPIAGATVSLTERTVITTDVNGFYQFLFWADTTVDLTVAMPTYYSQTVSNIALTMGNTVTQNFTLIAMPRVTLSGVVKANDVPAGLVGAQISVLGVENYSAISAAGGAFSIPNVLGSSATLSYTIQVSKEGYQTYISTLDVIASPVNLGTITLIEYLWTPYNLVATHAGDNAHLEWDPAGEPDYYFSDFETDNGGWVKSSNWTGTALPNYPDGDWEWNNSYNVANYNTDGGSNPQNPPATAHSGTGMWGTNIYGPYTNCTVSGQRSYLRQTFDLSVYNNPVISLWHYMDGYNTWDYGQILVNGTVVWGTSDLAVFMPWQELTVDLAAYGSLTNAEISIEWSSTTVSNYSGWYIDDIYIGPATRNATQHALRSGDRSFQNYSLYRLLAADADIPANWTTLQGSYAGTSYTDNGFSSLTGGKYKWAVKANYTADQHSNAILSNSLGRVYNPEDIAVNTAGSTVVLSWTAEPGANYYKIYASDNPYGTFTYLGYSATATYTVVSPAARKFYKVSAVADEAVPSPAPPAKSNK